MKEVLTNIIRVRQPTWRKTYTDYYNISLEDRFDRLKHNEFFAMGLQIDRAIKNEKLI
jgi:hypothetical protein